MWLIICEIVISGKVKTVNYAMGNKSYFNVFKALLNDIFIVRPNVTAIVMWCILAGNLKIIGIIFVVTWIYNLTIIINKVRQSIIIWFEFEKVYLKN